VACPVVLGLVQAVTVTTAAMTKMIGRDILGFKGTP
jgi:hypothetical protein